MNEVFLFLLVRNSQALNFQEKRNNHEKEIQSTIRIMSTHELLERIKFEASLGEAELLAKLEKANFDIADLKANLMDKETEL